MKGLYVCAYVRTYIRTYVRTYVCTYIRTYVHTYSPFIKLPKKLFGKSLFKTTFAKFKIAKFHFWSVGHFQPMPIHKIKKNKNEDLDAGPFSHLMGWASNATNWLRVNLSLCRFLKIVFAKCPCPKLKFARIGIKKSWRFEKTPPRQIKKAQIHFWMSWHFQTLPFPNLKNRNLMKGLYVRTRVCTYVRTYVRT